MVPLENGLLSIFSIWGRGRGGDGNGYIIYNSNQSNTWDIAFLFLVEKTVFPAFQVEKIVEISYNESDL